MPVVATYHIHPENLTASVYLDRVVPLNRAILELWKRAIFNRSDLVQCPSRSVYERVSKLRVRAPLLLLSNGVPLGEGVCADGREWGVCCRSRPRGREVLARKRPGDDPASPAP